ncbi:MAG: cytochrome c [Neomegalonema sp.]|nr:cytochrome c [Neomegalonema sp.]
MKLTFSRAVAALGVAAAVSVSSFAAAEDLNKAVKARRGYYQVISFNAGILFGMAKGQVAYDAELAKKAAGNLKAAGSIHADLMFPAGTDNGALKGQTRALPKIWSDAAGFAAKAAAFKTAADAVEAKSGDGLDALRSTLGALGGSCKGCHSSYRAKSF